MILTHFKCQFVLILVMKAPRFVDQVAQIIFDEHHGRAKLLMDILFTLIRQLVVITVGQQK